MAILVFIESAEGKIKKSSLEAVAFAYGMKDTVTAIAMGTIDAAELAGVGKYGASKVLHVSDARLDQGIIKAYASVLEQALAAENAAVLILANSSLGTPVAARVAAKIGAGLVSNVVELPNTSNGFVVKQSIYTGKAFAQVSITNQKKILVLKFTSKILK